MLAPHHSKSIEVQTARAFLRRLLRQAMAMSLSFGLTSFSIGSIAVAQTRSGDVPASPWSNRSEPIPTADRMSTVDRADREDINPTPSKRLRQPSKAIAAPNATPKADPIELPEPPANRQYRPAPVTLMGPMTPGGSMAPTGPTLVPTGQTMVPSNSRIRSERTSSASFGSLKEFSQSLDQDGDQAAARSQNRVESPFESRTAAPSQALTQKTPVVAQSDRQRLPAGGLPLDADESFPPPRVVHGSMRESVREQSTARLPSRIGVGLPDRMEDTSVDTLPSQMASVKSTFGQNEPIQLQATTRPKPTAEFDEQEKHLSPSSSSRATSGPKPSWSTPVVEEPSALSEPRDREPFVMTPTDGRPERRTTQDADATLDVLARVVSERQDQIQMKRIALADRVSHELLSNSPVDFAGEPQALEALPGWQAIEQELRQRLDRCDTLLKRGAVLSAREEALQGLLRLYRTMDLHRGKMYSEAALEKALTALREGLDFQRSLGSSSHSAVQSIVNTHSTDALKNRPLDSTSTEMAAMHYRWYARHQLVTASDGHPWAADLLYAFGKTIEKEADLHASRATLYRNQAVVFYQAATQVKPTHSEAASQLGYALIHLDRLDDAYVVLSTSVRQNPSANAWNNLAEVYRRRGASSEAEYAVQQANTFSQTKTTYSSENPEIVEIDPSTFAKYSPMPTMTNSSPIGTPNGTAGNRPPTPSDSAAGVRSAKSGNRFLSKIFQ